MNNNRQIRVSLSWMRSCPLVNYGFALIDIMIGLLIGAFAIIVMLNVFALSEGQKRTTTSGSDAQVNGLLAIYTLKSEINQSGYGINSTNLLGKTVSGFSEGNPRIIAPVIINHPDIKPGDPNTDTLLFFYGNSVGSPDGEVFDAKSIRLPSGYVINTSFLLEKYDPTITSGKIYDLGDTPTMRAYRVYKSDLWECDYFETDCSMDLDWHKFISNIVSLRAEYGIDIDIPVDYKVDQQYTQTLPQNTPLCRYARIRSVRFVIVARHNQKEKPDLLTQLPVTNQSFTWMSAVTKIDLTRIPSNIDVDDWKNYRYTVLQTEAPIRNISWLNLDELCKS